MGLYTLTVNITQIKGVTDEPQEMSVSGYPFIYSETDCIYWLNLYV